jgi:diguanylate cyclase (GGDEF)-like protein/PAS domain S-box-containing protein
MTANLSFYKAFKVTPEETIGHFIYDLGNRQWDILKLRILLEDILPNSTVFNDYEVEHNFPNIGHKVILLNAREIFRKETGSKIILLAMQDITHHKDLEREHKDALKYSENIIDTMREPLLVLSSDHKVMTANLSFYKAFKVTPEETIGHSIYDLGNRQWDIPKLRTLLEDILPNATVFNDYEVQHSFPYVGYKVFLLNAREIFREKMGTHIILLSMEDITKNKQQENESSIAAIAFESQEGMLVTDANGKILRANHAFTKITGYTTEEIIGKNPRILQSGLHTHEFYATMWESIKDNGVWSGEVWNRRKDGVCYPEHLTITAVCDANSIVTNYIGTITDITKSHAAAAEIQHLAFYDPLTGLPNIRLLRERLKPALVSSYRSGRKGALLFIDLDNFKTLNDTLGHNMGDLLLQQVAQRLEFCVREGDTVARMGGDEFVVMLEDLSELTLEAAVQAEVIGNKILDALSQPYQLVTSYYQCTSSIGSTLFNDDDQSADELLKQADIAMYQAKDAGRNAMRFFDQQMQISIDTRVAMEADLRLAITENQFELYYQPQVNHNRQIIGAEVLIRWQHPQNGFTSPADFIPLAEATGLILPIGAWVLETACIQLKSWENDFQAQHLLLAVNVSARQFHQVDFVEQVQLVILRSGINPERLKLELTESLVLDNIDDTIIKMNALREIGVRFSMDDFGTGYSSLSSLKKLPLNQLKIDQSFVRDIASDPDDVVIVQTIIAMAKSLGMAVIAEGVETEVQRAFLEQHDCHLYQGYLFSRPVPIEQFETLLRQS